MNKKKDKWDICRTCGNGGDIEIFGRDGVTLQLEDKINTYLPITVNYSFKKKKLIRIYILESTKVFEYFLNFFPYILKQF